MKYIETLNPTAYAKVMEFCNEMARRDGHTIPETYEQPGIREGSRCTVPRTKWMATNYTDAVTHKDDASRKAVRIGPDLEKHDGVTYDGYKVELKNCTDNSNGWTEDDLGVAP